MDLAQLGAQLLRDQLGDADGIGNAEDAINALGGGGGIDLGSVVSGMMVNGSLQDVVSSWLGDGDNSPIDASQLTEIFQSDQLQAFAEKLGLDLDSALNVLSQVLPNLVDQSSSGGSLLDAVGGLDGVMDFAKKLF